MTRRVLLSGSAGFVGSHVLRHFLENTDWEFALPVTFRHKGTPQRIVSALDGHPEWWSRADVIHCDLTSPIDSITAHLFGDVDAVLNIASESHVDRSIEAPGPFVRNNIDIMISLLEYARQAKPSVFLHMGTDEEYGAAYGNYKHREWDTIIPSNPYSASKAAQSALATAWWRTYQVPVVLTRTMNLIAPGQDGEKFVPTVIRKILNEDTVQIHSSPEGVPGSRHWIDAREFAGAWLHILKNANVQMHPEHDRPTMYHVVGEERSNLDIAHTISDALGQQLRYELVSFHSSRPGHDLRYALDGKKLAELGWKPSRSLDESIQDIVKWYVDNPMWMEGS
jgi:dTDP-glucose 4,6-dehydratase